LPCLNRTVFAVQTEPLNLRDFGAVGDGVVDDGPAFQKALDALAAAGGGTLFIPEGKYVIATPVYKNFSGSASSIEIIGVESLTPVAPPTALAHDLAAGLDLLSEVYPRTGETQMAIAVVGLRSLVVKDIAFVGTPTAITDAAVTLFLSDIDKAQIKHSEFYGLATFAGYGGIVESVRSDLEITQSKFLGCTATSGLYIPIVENLEWRGLTVSDTTFLDYGLRPELYGKMGYAAPVSWINIGNAAPPTNNSPRREVVLRNVFLDEGGYWGLTSFPSRYSPPSAPIDLIYITGLVMNVSNFNTVGHLLYDARRVFIENSRYGWSHNASAAVALFNVGTGILDHLSCVADADRIYADSTTGELTVINSTYATLDSSAKKTNTINTATDDDDPVQYVRKRFAAVLGREPDPAAHFYWSDLLIRCYGDVQCQDGVKEELNNYLADSPSPRFAISGRVVDQRGAPLSGVTIALSGLQSATTTTDSDGQYVFSSLPTSGSYSITPMKAGYGMWPVAQILNNVAGDTVANFQAMLPPILLTMPDSDRAIALELTSFLPEPFPLTSTLLAEGHNRTRITIFGTNLGLLEGEGVEALTAEAEDAAKVRYPLRVEFVSALPDLPNVDQIVLRLSGALDDAGGEVLISISAHGLTSNKVRIKLHDP
jgi:hypothetical protein